MKMNFSQQKHFCKDLFNYSRRHSNEVKIGNTPLGGENPIRVQSMANTNTNDIDASVKQAIGMIESGAEYIRFTAQGRKEAENLRLIKNELTQKGYHIPLVADIHFNPKVALLVAKYVDKIRINPGNFAGNSGNSGNEEFDYEQGLIKIREQLIPLLDLCKTHKTALRIGTNHGSLSKRIVNRYGNTPKGMVEATMEFLRICTERNFKNLVISIKSSNTVVMVKTLRLLICEMNKENMKFPLHLGVTEAGEGEDGRIKSAVGIGALLNDGIGDTIRISLTEEPGVESPLGKKLINHVLEKDNHAPILPVKNTTVNFMEFYKRSTTKLKNIGGDKVPLVILDFSDKQISAENLPQKAGYFLNQDTLEWKKNKFVADYICVNSYHPCFSSYPQNLGIICSNLNSISMLQENVFPLLQAQDLSKHSPFFSSGKPVFVECDYADLNDELIHKMKTCKNLVIICKSNHQNAFAEQRAFALRLIASQCKTPIVFKRTFTDSNLEDFQLKASCDLGSLFFDGLGNGICLVNSKIPCTELLSSSFGILQAARVRISKTEFVSCPGCGRTLFQLQKVVAKVKKEFSHLTRLKIGIMGCIVNGPGEMGDVDYGYVGSGQGKVSLYKSQKLMLQNIPEKNAIDELKKIMKTHGDWIDRTVKPQAEFRQVE